MRSIIIALPKGDRVLKNAYAVFARAGITSPDLENEIAGGNRKQLEFISADGRVTFLLVRNAEIPQYVDKSWADMGVVGFDCYREYELSGISQNSSKGDGFISDLLPDLGLCSGARFCVAGKPALKDFYLKCKKNSEKVLTCGTSYPNIAVNYLVKQGILADVIAAQGSVELMPKYADADIIFDIVESGSALKQNGLIIFEECMPIQTKILVSKAAFKYDPNIARIVGELKNALK
jgi:ATP phosphoribosyltransferase